jgi:superfamily II DNA or RNA helicase
MLVTLRPYQAKTVDDVRNSYREYRSTLAVLSTGGGKTVIFTYITERVSARGKSVWILVHRQELLGQTSRHLTKLGVTHGLIAPGHSLTGDSVQVASVQTLVRRLGKLKPPDLIVLDEAHHCNAKTWRIILDAFPHAKLLGVTATPCRLDGTGLGVTSGGYFEYMVEGPSIRELIDTGYLSQPIVYAPPTGIDLSGVHTRMGDYVQSEVEARIDKPKITGSAIKHYLSLCPGVPAIAFCASVRHAEHVAEEFNSYGIPSASIDGSMPDAMRRHRLHQFTSGQIKVLTNYNIVSEGFDLPAITTAILLRPTQSLSLYLQQVGRALRPCPEIGKTHAIILDHVGNCFRHGMPDEVREWSLNGVKKRKRKDEEILFNQCKKCYAVFDINLQLCPQCQEPVLLTEKEKKQRAQIQQTEGDLMQITQDMMQRRMKRIEQGRAQSLEELIKIGKDRGYHHQWAYRVYNSRKQKQREQLRLAV